MKDDTNKLDLTLVPPQIIEEIAKVREYGTTNKYNDPDNWRDVPPEKFFKALLRHVLAMWSTDIYKQDPESGLLHLSHAATNIAFLLQFCAEDKESIQCT